MRTGHRHATGPLLVHRRPLRRTHISAARLRVPLRVGLLLLLLVLVLLVLLLLVLLVLLLLVSLLLLRRYGIIDHITKLSEGTTLERTPSGDAKISAVTVAASHFLSLIQDSDVEGLAEATTKLKELAARIEDAEQSAVEELAALLRQPDGITQHEFESAGLVDSVLAL
eukprot:COSAG04_NODE_10084_length_805_cov_1.375354_1_plen_168_part_01